MWLATLLLLLSAGLPLLCCWCLSLVGVETVRGALRLWLEGMSAQLARLVVAHKKPKITP